MLQNSCDPMDSFWVMKLQSYFWHLCSVSPLQKIRLQCGLALLIDANIDIGSRLLKKKVQEEEARDGILKRRTS